MSGRTKFEAIQPALKHAPSYYAATVRERVETAVLDRDIQCDVAVVGGGYTGLSAALHLARRGVNVAVLEQSLLGWGASGRNGGQVHVGVRRDQPWLEKHCGMQAARQLWAQAITAREHLDWLIDTYGIDCELRQGLLHVNHKPGYLAHTQAHVDYLRRHYDYHDLRMVSKEEVRSLVASEDYHSGSLDLRGGHLHALNFALGIARAAQSHGAALYEGAGVTHMDRDDNGWRLQTAKGTVRAARVLLACNGYLQGLSPTVASHVMPINNFIAVTEPLGEARATALIRNGYAVADSRFVVYYFRMTPDHRLLFGGGENYSYRFPADIHGFVRRHLTRIFPQLTATRLDYAWGGTLAVTPNRMPFIRELEQGLFNASGFSGMGVVMSPYAGKLMADAMCGDDAALKVWREVPAMKFPGGSLLRWPTLVAAMSLAALSDRL